MSKTNRDIEYSLDHCKERFLERYNRELNIENYKKWNNLIRNKLAKNEENTVEIINTDKSNMTVHIIKIVDENEKIYCSFEEQRNCITTFLPIESVENRIKKDKKIKK